MSDAPSLPTRTELDQLLPGRLVGWNAIDAATKHSRNHDDRCVRIKKRYLAIPRKAWDEIGSPARADIRWEGWDIYILGCSNGTQVQFNSRQFVRLLFDAKGGSSWDRMLVRGHYPYRVRRLHGLPCVHVSGCNFSNITPDWLKAWGTQQRT